MDIIEKEMGVDHTIQVHSFLGTLEELKLWQERFPNVYFSIPVRSRINSKFHLALQGIPRERLLLETDAPYGETGRHTTPWDIPDQCIHLARILNVSTEELLVLTHRNASRFFNISPILQAEGDKE